MALCRELTFIKRAEEGDARRALLCLRRIPNTQADTFFGSECGYTNTFLAPVKHFISPLGEPVIKRPSPPTPTPATPAEVCCCC